MMRRERVNQAKDAEERVIAVDWALSKANGSRSNRRWMWMMREMSI